MNRGVLLFRGPKRLRAYAIRNKKEMKISKDSICIVGILATVVIVCITCNTLIRGGYARDAGIIVPAVVDNLVWVTIPICCIALFLFLFLLKSADSKKKRNLAAVIFIMVALWGGISNIMWIISFHKEENAGVQHANIREITLDELENVIVGNDTQTVMAGRALTLGGFEKFTSVDIGAGETLTRAFTIADGAEELESTLAFGVYAKGVSGLSDITVSLKQYK